MAIFFLRISYCQAFSYLFGSSTQAPVLLNFRSSQTFIIVTVASAVFTDIFVYACIVPVLPFALVSRAKTDPADTQTWISILLAVYGAGLVIAAPFVGWLADKTKSRQLPLLLGLLALGGSTAMLTAGNSIGILVAGRALQGMSSAMVWVVGLALLVDTMGSEGVGQAMGYVGTSMSMSLLAAPLLGGVVFVRAGYYAVFAMAYGLIVLDVFLRLALVEKKMAAKWLPQESAEPARSKPPTPAENRDSVGDIEMDTNATSTDARVATGQPQERPAAPNRTTSTTSPAEAAASNALPENAPPMLKHFISGLPPILFLLTSRRVLSAIWASTVQSVLLAAFDTILPIFVRDTFHWNSLGAGLIFLPIVVVSFLGPIIGMLSDKYGSRWFATAGYVLASPCLILLRLVHKNTLDQKILLCALLCLIGFGITLVVTPIMAEITYSVVAKAEARPPGYFGKNGAFAQAYSLYNVAWAVGFMVGPLLGGLINQHLGWPAATLVLGCISILTAVPTAIWTGGSIFKKARRRREQRGRGDVEEATAS